jgi:hypothetical protein
MIRPQFLLLGFLLLCLAAATSARAEAPPWRVGRIAAVEAGAAFRAAGGEWIDSVVNDPVAAGMSVRTGPQGRAVMRVGAETITLAPASEIDLVALDAGNTEIVLRRGRIAVVLSSAGPARNVAVDTTRGGFWLKTPGAYDIAAGDDHTPARAVAYDGEARIAGKGVDTTAAAGSAVALGGDPAAVKPEDANADDFILWSRRQGGDDADLPALHSVSAEMTGYETLDPNGSWESVDGYGMVWFPQAGVDWVPFRYGHWRWIAAWGWNWIDDMPWGFATSHYGRWAVIPGADPGLSRWGWVPGDRVAEPAYAPALVAFLGTPGVGLSYADSGGPAIAWFPLAPGETYWPSYTTDLDAIRRLNPGDAADVAAIVPGADGLPPLAVMKGVYRNRRSASVVPRAVFVGGRPAAPALVRLPEERLDNAPLLAGSPQITPPAPRPVALASPPPGRLALMASKLMRAAHSLTHLPPGRRLAGARAGAIIHQAHARSGIVYAAAPQRMQTVRASRRVVAVTAPRPAQSRLHLAAARRGIVR